MIQQAVMQVLQGSWDNTFSESSYAGFVPDARRIKQWRVPSNILLRGTAGWSTSIWKKFFDRVNHDRLMGQIAGGECTISASCD